MPIVYVHGVNVRRQQPGGPGDYFPAIGAFLERYVLPEIAGGDGSGRIIDAHWGDLVPDFAWGGRSCPEGLLYGMGAPETASELERAVVATQFEDALGPAPVAADRPAGGLVAAGATTTAAASRMRLKDLAPSELSDLLAAVIDPTTPDGARAAMDADDVAHDPAMLRALAAAPDRAAELDAIERSLRARRAGDLASMGGGPTWFDRLREQLDETLRRAEDLPGSIATQVVSQIRRPLNAMITRFEGDVFNYLSDRGTPDAPGTIPLRIIGKLEEARQRAEADPLVVMTHSMGGQLVYDLVTYFLPNMPRYRDLRIDFWCASASQVGLFEELQLFQGTAGRGYGKDKPVPFPPKAHLGGWWNVWDRNDFLSYRAAGIVEGVDDEAFTSGLSALEAHGGYLVRPSFYRRFAEKVRVAKAGDWGRA